MFTKREVLQKAASDALYFAGSVLAELEQSVDLRRHTFRVPIDIVNGRVRRWGGNVEIPANVLREYRSDARRWKKPSRRKAR
jgi:hypothetical protein